MPNRGSVGSCKFYGSYGNHLLDHLAADGTGFAGSQVAVIAVGQVDANLPWCPFYIVNSLFRGFLGWFWGLRWKHPRWLRIQLTDEFIEDSDALLIAAILPRHFLVTLWEHFLTNFNAVNESHNRFAIKSFDV